MDLVREERRFMRIVMVGTGYVGLVSGACIADFGHQVTCVDTDDGKISALKAGNIPIYEPGLKEIVQSNIAQGRLSFTTALSEALEGAVTDTNVFKLAQPGTFVDPLTEILRNSARSLLAHAVA
jgi:UDP-glucose 6-dehydrogenase